jgi:hypothetical protein
MLATISRQERSQSRSDLAAVFMGAESNRSTSAAVTWQASAHAAHEKVISALCFEIVLVDSPQNPAQSDSKCSGLA